jgi:hypothetical protein
MKTFIALAFALTTSGIFAQLEDGSIAPDFTATDINGMEHNLYDYLGQGKTVIIDFFAAHCPSCWNYHNQGHVEDLYQAHGPSGLESQDIVVLAIEFDSNNGTDELYGISGNTQGNWVEGSSYPIINPEGSLRTEILGNYEVIFYPMVYCICPDGTVTFTGAVSSSSLYSTAMECESFNSVGEGTEMDDIVVTYNAVQNALMFSGVSENSKITGFDSSGKLILDTTLESSIDMVSLPSSFGPFVLLHIVSVSGESTVMKVKL